MSFLGDLSPAQGLANNSFNLGQNQAAMQQQQASYAQQAALAAQNQAALNNAYGPQGFGGQTAYYAGLGASYGRAVPGEIYGGGGGGDVWSQGAAPYNEYGLNGQFNTATGNIGQSPGMAPGFGGFNNPATPQNPISWYVNGGYDPFDPRTYGGSAQQNLGTGYPGMIAPQGTSSGGYDPQWGGTSSYPQGPQSSAPDYSPASLMYGSSGTNFDTAGYFAANPDALDAYRSGTWGISDPTKFAETHFLAAHNNEGAWRSGWAPSNNPNFNAAGYYEANPDALNAFASSGSLDPTKFAEQHLLAAHNNPTENGAWRTGWAPNTPAAGFDAAGYFANNPDALEIYGQGGWGMTDPTQFAEQHFLAAHNNEGGNWRTGWAPNNPNFDAAGYYAANPDALEGFAASGYKDPTAFAEQHLLAAHNNPAEGGAWRTGWAPGSPDFDTQGYFAANPDALEAYGTGNWGISDPTRFAEAHLAAAHANPAEGGTWRGGWQLAGDDRGLAFAPKDWTSPYGSKGGLSPSGEIANNPYAPPPGADISNPSSYWHPSEGDPNQWETSRAPYTTQLAQDPARMYDMAVRLYLELNDDSQGRQGIAEAMFNRNAARGLDPLSADYFPQGSDYLSKYNNATRDLRNNPQLLGQIYSEIGQAAAGSNISGGATDWASADVARNAARTSTPTWSSPAGESFFRKDLSNSTTGVGAAKQIQDWYNSMLNWQPQ